MTKGIAQPRFHLGAVNATRGVANLEPTHEELAKLLQRHQSGDWGDVPAEDADENEFAVNKALRIISSYVLKGEKVWIITEADRSSTTILFPSEY